MGVCQEWAEDASMARKEVEAERETYVCPVIALSMWGWMSGVSGQGGPHPSTSAPLKLPERNGAGQGFPGGMQSAGDSILKNERRLWLQCGFGTGCPG